MHPWTGIVAITRGGLVPASIIARELEIRLVDIQYSLTLITGNTKHFMNIPGLRIEDWIGG